MNARQFVAPALFLFLLGTACAGFSSYRYHQTYALVSPVDNGGRYYEDGGLAFRFEVTEKKILVHVANNTPGEVRLEWPSVRYIDPDGKEHEIANLQTLFTESADRIKPDTLAPGATEENVIVPLPNIEKMEQWTWKIKPLFNQEDETALENRGKTFSLVFPVRNSADEEKIYNFTFKVVSVVYHRSRTPG